jgi:hypothetical protein
MALFIIWIAPDAKLYARGVPGWGGRTVNGVLRAEVDIDDAM